MATVRVWLKSNKTSTAMNTALFLPGEITRRSPPSIELSTALVFAMILATSAIAQTTQTIRHHPVPQENPLFPPQLTQAEAAIEKKDYATAQPLLEKVVEANPNNYQAWFDLGFVFHAVGKIEESIAAYRKSVAAKPDVFESNLNLGLTLVQSGNPEAEKYLRAATGLKPTSHVDEGQFRAWLSLAHLLESSKPVEAIEAYRRAETLQPKDPEPHLAAGLLFEKQNQLKNAEQEYAEALKLDPGSTEAITALANTYMRERQLPQAEQMLRQLTAAHPNDGAVRIQLGTVLGAEDKKEDAIAELQAGLALTPGDGVAQRDLADLYASSGNYDKAGIMYQSLMATNPKDPVLHDDLGKALLKLRRFPEAQQEFMVAVQLKPDFGAAWGDLAVAADENKNYELAIKAVDERAKFLPEIPISYFLRATAYDHLRDRKRAILNYHDFLNVANGKFPDQEWQARQRLKAIEQMR
jgi:tetratricopeptide (TPR) repeat protein